MAEIQIFIKKVLWKNDFVFPAAIWLVSRLLIWAAMLVIAPHLGAPSKGITPEFGWGVFDAWDSVHYRAIATSGYEFANDGKQHNLAFFPLFPLLIWVFIKLGLPFEIAGTLINNLAFFAALYYIYFWVDENYGTKEARWTTAVVAWCPLSMFGTVIYTEGLYLLLSTAALRAFEQKRYQWTIVWGAMATATRPTGLALIPGFLLAAYRQRRPFIAYVAGFATAIGVLLFSLYCAIQFGDALGFLHAQRGWRPTLGFYWQGWLEMLLQITLGTSDWESLGIKDYLHPLFFGIVVGYGYYLWRLGKHLSFPVVCGFYTLISFLLILADDWFIYNLLNAAVILGGGYMLWHLRTQLTPVTVMYGLCGISLLLASGGTISLGRLAYGIVSLSIAFGVFLSRHPRQGYLSLGVCAILLGRLALKFAQELWVG
ncbi:mannosyltransferase family protein [Scytonema sp. PRP1]|uniref:mannosyltransferase family protein n=1 Tax=Scytonema sp. PRP1 TaxID=3120513 RepID=UPI002FD3BF85